MATSEAALDLTHGISLVAAAVLDVVGTNLGTQVRQVHAAWAAGIEKSRKEVLLCSVCVADYRHTIKAVESGVHTHADKKNIKDITCAPITAHLQDAVVMLI